MSESPGHFPPNPNYSRPDNALVAGQPAAPYSGASRGGTRRAASRAPGHRRPRSTQAARCSGRRLSDMSSPIVLWQSGDDRMLGSYGYG